MINASHRFTALCCFAVLGCSSDDKGDGNSMGNLNTGGDSPADGGETHNGGAGGNTGGTVHSGGSGATSGAGGTDANPEGGAGGDAADGGSSGESNSGGTGGAGETGGSGGIDNGDTPPWRPLNIVAAADEYVHNINGRPAGVDTRVPTMMGKLIIDLGVDAGGLYRFGMARGFHVYGAQMFHCPDIDNWDLGRDYNGDCRLEAFDGMDHTDRVTVNYADSVVGRVTDALTQLADQFPDEDWGYFLNQDGTVRWSDVGFTGFSHGAQSAARFGVAVRLYRAVSRSGPRDNTCGTGPATGDFDPNNPPYDPNCSVDEISSWLDEEPATPRDRFFGFVGKGDGQYGDIMFGMERLGLTGEPVNIDTTPPPYGGSHRFYADTGHSGFDDYTDALNIAWGVPPENIAYAAGN